MSLEGVDSELSIMPAILTSPPPEGSPAGGPRSAPTRGSVSVRAAGSRTRNHRPSTRTTTHSITPSTGKAGLVLPACWATTRTAAPSSAGTAYRPSRSTVGTRPSSTSRSIPPPMPVSVPSRIAWTGPRPYSRAFVAPVTANRPRPKASKTMTLRRIRSSAGPAKKQTRPAAAAAAR